MKKYISILIILFSTICLAQDEEEVNSKELVREGFLFGFNATPSFTGADLNKRFGMIMQFGPSILYKSRENWISGISYNVMFGRTMNEPVGGNLINNQGNVIGNDGFIADIQPSMSGFNIQFQTGKLIKTMKKNRDSGILLMGGVGFMQHKIRLRNSFDTTPQLTGNYLKGYDKLTNGLMLSQTISFFKIDKRKLFNYQIGVDLGQGFTRNRRNFNFDTLSAEDDLRFDFLVGLKFSIYIPLNMSAQDEYYY